MLIFRTLVCPLLKQNNMDNGSNNEEKEIHQETSTEGLVLKELLSHLKYAY